MSTMAQKLKEHIKLSEGFVAKPYICPAGKQTIGYGFNIEDRGIPEEVADYWLEHELRLIEEGLSKDPVYLMLDPVRQSVLLDMAYNLGLTRLRKFKKMFRALYDRDFKKASEEMLDSKWARQVKGRAQKLSEIMHTGHWA